MEEIGFLGIGIMGKAMAVNLLRHGFKVTVWNRTLSRVLFFSTLLTKICDLIVSLFNLKWIPHPSAFMFLFTCFFLCMSLNSSFFFFDQKLPQNMRLPYNQHQSSILAQCLCLLWIFQCDELVQHGASVGETPAAVIKKCKYTIAMLSDPAAALSVN